MIFLACLLTVLIEGSFFALLGYRDRFSLTVIVCANVITNLLLNLFILLVFRGSPGLSIIWMELCVIAAECAIYFAAFGKSWNLLFLTFAANCISYGLGLLIFQ